MKYEARFLRMFLLGIVIMLLVIPLNKASAADDGRIRIGLAVYANPEMGLSVDDARLITNILTDNLIGIRNVALIERHRLDTILEELGFSHTDPAVDEKTKVEIGKIAGLQYIITSSLSSRWEKSGNEYKYYAVACTINVRLINVETAEVHLSISETKSARNGSWPIGGIKNPNSAQEQQVLQSLRTKAIEDTTSELAKKLRDEITKMSRLTMPSLEVISLPGPADSPQPQTLPEVQTRLPATTNFENISTDHLKVIDTYPLSAGDKNVLIIRHNRARMLKEQQAYDAYAELANSYSGDYFAAYQAGEKARELKRNNEAITWYDRALSINPNYEPAQRARAQM